MKYKTIIVGIILIGLFFVFGCTDTGADTNKEKVIMFKDPECGCCLGHASFLEGNGFHVEKNNISDMQSIKSQYDIPYSVQSCHTTIIGEYFVEGHVPIEAINKLLLEKPDIDGIALPDMPAGSPGMPGIKKEKWEIYSIKDGEIVGVFMTI